MDDLICPDCQKPVLNIKKAESLLRSTTTKTLMSRCSCGVTYEIRSLRQDILEIYTSSGKKIEHFLKRDK